MFLVHKESWSAMRIYDRKYYIKSIFYCLMLNTKNSDDEGSNLHRRYTQISDCNLSKIIIQSGTSQVSNNLSKSYF